MHPLKSALRACDWLFVAALAPLMLFPQAERAWTLLLYLLILGLQWWAWGEVLPVTPLNLAILLVALMIGVSVFVTPDLVYSLGKVAGLLLGILVFFTVFRHSTTKRGWKIGFWLLTLVGMGIAVIGLLATAWLPSKIISLTNIISLLPARFISLPGAEAGINVNELAGGLLWVLPLVILGVVALIVEPRWFLGQNKKDRLQSGRLLVWVLWLLIAAGFYVGVFILSQSRDGYLALAFSLPLLVLVLARGRVRYWFLGLLMILVIAGIIVVNHGETPFVLNQLFETLPAKNGAFTVNSMFGRVEIWKAAIRGIQDSPLTGLGMNNFRTAIHSLNPVYKNPGYDVAHAHNELLQAALDLGLPGLVGFFALYVGALTMLARPISRNGAPRLLAIGLFGSLLAHFLFGITDAVALGAKPGFLFWWLLALASGLYEQTRAGRTVLG